jgi:hypothetical protein
MRRPVVILLCIAALLSVGLIAYRVDCQRHEAAFQARFQQLSRDAHEKLKLGTPKEAVLQFFSENHLQTRSDQLRAWAWVYGLRGCTRGLGCAIGPDGGKISVDVSLDEQGRVNSEPVMMERYVGGCM